MRTHLILGAALGVGLHLATAATAAPAAASGCPTRHLIEDSGPEIRVAVGVPDCSMAAETPRVTFVDCLVAFLTGRPAEPDAGAAPSAPNEAAARIVPTPRPTAGPEGNRADGALNCNVKLASLAHNPGSKDILVHLKGAAGRGGRPTSVSGMLDVVVDGSNSTRSTTDFAATLDRSGQGAFEGPTLPVGRGDSVAASITTEAGRSVGCSVAR